MKTIAEWFNEIQDPEIAKNARRAIVKQGKNIERPKDSLGEAINYFTWSDTEQGQDYWSTIKYRADNRELI